MSRQHPSSQRGWPVKADEALTDALYVGKARRMTAVRGRTCGLLWWLLAAIPTRLDSSDQDEAAGGGGWSRKWPENAMGGFLFSGGVWTFIAERVGCVSVI